MTRVERATIFIRTNDSKRLIGENPQKVESFKINQWVFVNDG